MRQKYPLLSAIWEQNRIKVILILVLLLLAAGAYIGQRWFIDPYLQNLSTEQFRLQQHVRQRQVEFANSGVPVSTAEQIEKNLRQFNTLIPRKIDFSAFLGELFGWATQAGLAIHQVNYQPELDDETGFLRYGMNFSVEGDYSQVKNFIHLLEGAERILIVEKISLSDSSSKKDQNGVSLRIDMTTYFQGRAE